MPNTDIRLQLSFRSHPKVLKLARRLGKPAVLGLIYLFMFAAESKPDGRLAGMDAEDITLAADWDGEAKDFVGALVELRLLDKLSEGYAIHAWAEHQPWAAGAEERSQKAKTAARARWGQTADEAQQDAGRMRPASINNAPSPSPSPNPNPSLSKEKVVEEEVFISIPLKDGSDYEVAASEVAGWSESYPELGTGGVERCLREMREWCLSKPQKRKTRRGARAFITGWLGREDRRRPPPEVLERAKGNPYLAATVEDADV